MACTEAVVRKCSNFAKCTGKHLCRSPFLIKFQAGLVLESLFNKVATKGLYLY